MIAPGLPALNYSHLADQWPKWRQYFEIYILAAFNNTIEDHHKLGLFLHCLGHTGIELINGWFPELRDINSPPAMDVSFDDVWNKWHLFCNPKEKPIKVESSVVENVADVCAEPKAADIDKAPEGEKDVKSTSLDIHFLCEIENLVREVPEKKPTIQRLLSEGHQLSIDSSTLARYPITDNGPIYAEYAVHTTNMEISGVPESELEQLLMIFANIKQLTLKDVTLPGSDLPKYPLNLRNLKLIGCSGERIFEWLNRNRTSLETLHIEDVVESSETLLTNPFDKLKFLTMVGSRGYSRNQFPICLAIETLYLDVPKAVYYFNWSPGTPLKSLTLNHCWPKATTQIIMGYRHLQDLTILNEVDPNRKKEIDGLRLKEVDVRYVDVNAVQTNLIFNLNDDCLLHLMELLPDEDCKTLKDVHPRFIQPYTRLMSIYRIRMYACLGRRK